MTWSVDRLNGLFRSVWNAFDPRNERSSRMATIACIVRLNVVTLQRTTEILGMKTSGIDLENGLWQVRTSIKTTAHVIPLTPLALSLIGTALALRRNADSEWVFQFPGKTEATSFLLSRQFRNRLQALSYDGVILHDIRRAGRTLLSAPPMSVPTATAANVFGHYDDPLRLPARATPSDLHAIDDKRRTLELWEKRLGEITGDQPDNTVPTPALGTDGRNRH